MFQDWPEEKRKALEVVLDTIRRGTRANAPVVEMVTSITISEGSAIALIAPDGTRTDTPLRQHHAKAEISREQMLGDPLAPFQVVKQLAESLGQQLDKGLVDLLKDASPSTGGMISGESPEAFRKGVLERLEAMDISFDDDGDSGLAFLMHPEMAAKLAALPEDPEFKSQFDVVMERKRSEWLRRESSRRLVD